MPSAIMMSYKLKTAPLNSSSDPWCPNLPLQSDRITESISAADVADICLRSLHEPAARNKTFDVCYEVDSEAGQEMYEMVARGPAKSDSYLRNAVASLVKNT